MAGNDEHVIENDVVRIGSELEKGFVKNLQAKVDAATSRVTAKVRLVADATGFSASAAAVLKSYAAGHKKPEYKVALVADATGLAASVRAATGAAGAAKVHVDLDFDGAGLVAKVEAAARQAGGVSVHIDTDFDGADLAAKVQAAVTAAGGLNVKVAVDVDAHHLRDSVKLALLAGEPYSIKVKADIDRSQLGALERLVGNSTRRGARNGLLSGLQQDPLINFGGAGIRPMNLLYAGLAALSPLLVSVASSAALAGSSIAALGAAGIGAGVAIGGLVLAFKGVVAALKLRSSVLAEQQTTAANANKLAATELKNQKAINDARQQAIRDLQDLKQKLIDLQNQEKSNTLSIREAQANRAKVYGNYFSTSLERARADQDVSDAKVRLQDTALNRKQAQQDLAKSKKTGIEGSDKVVAAKDAAASATKAVTSPAAQLKAQLAKLSPAARDLYNLIDKNQTTFDNLQRTIQQGVLPGFTNALQTLLQVDKHGGSTLQLFADGAAKLGGALGDLTHDLTHVFRTKWFRGDFKKIIKINEKAIGVFGKGGNTLLKPLMTIFTAAAPLLTRFAGGFADVATWFDKFISKASRTGKLQDFFKRAGDEFGRWMGLAKQVGRFVVALFTATAPSGSTIIGRLTDFFKNLADWASSPTGQKKIKDFFDKIAGLPYGKIANFITQVGAMFTAGLAVKFMFKNPLWTLIGVLAASDPQAATKFMQTITNFIIDSLGWVQKHPAAASTLLGILAGVRLLGKTGLTKLFTGTAGVGTIVLGGLAAATLTVGAILGTGPGGAIEGWESLFKGPKAYGDWSRKNPIGGKHYLGHALSQNLPNLLNLGGGEGGWAGLGKNTGHWFSTTLPNWLSGGHGGWAGLGKEVLKQAIDQIGLKLSSGTWRGIGEGTGLPHFFSQTLPDWISGQSGGWSGLGKAMGDHADKFIGQRLAHGVWVGISSTASWLWKKLKKWVSDFLDRQKEEFGIHSPSTKMAEIGAQLVNGLWKGFVDQWTRIYKTVVSWIDKNITSPLVNLFDTVGQQIKAAFINPFATLAESLAGPVKAAFSWINSNLINPLNVLLHSIGLPKIDLIQTTATTSGTGTAVGSAAGNAANTLAGVLKKADGGSVPGYSPNSRADNIPAMLTAGEWVQPKVAVDHYGPAFMEAVRTRRLPKYADGGLVGGLVAAQGTNLATSIVAGALSPVTSLAGLAGAIAAAAYGAYTGGAADGSIGDNGVAETAEAAGRAAGATDKQLIALIAAGIVESRLTNLTKAVDHDSLGFLQQRPSQGWGSPAQITNVGYAATKFIRAAQRMDNPGLTAGELAADVQRPAKKYRGRYALQEGNAAAIINARAPYLTGYSLGNAVGSVVGGSGGLFGPWPASPALDHGHDSGVWRNILSLVAPTGLDRHSYGDLYANRHTDNGGWSWHSDGRAADFGGYNQDKLAQFFEARKAHVLELIHHTDTADYGIRRGQTHDMGHEYGLHKNHLHVAMASGGEVRARKYDTGGTLPPGYTLAFNGTGKNETIRTHHQEKALSGPIRLDRRDMAILAAHIAGAASPAVHMDGRQVATITNSYNSYLPAGV